MIIAKEGVAMGTNSAYSTSICKRKSWVGHFWTDSPPLLIQAPVDQLQPLRAVPVGLIVGVTFGATALFFRKNWCRCRIATKHRSVMKPSLVSCSVLRTSYGGYSSVNDNTAHQIKPFVSNSNMGEPPSLLSSKAAQMRQEYLATKLHAAQKELEALPGPISPSNSGSTSSMGTSGGGVDSLGLTLQERIRVLIFRYLIFHKRSKLIIIHLYPRLLQSRWPGKSILLPIEFTSQRNVNMKSGPEK
ncbi:hypothetical protein B0H17DRAFT_1127024 [Mycena rosella]|uniref:Uncharacterized protein n=1 Tax=Mycena rosella TaxID=1033263 RepID=A0AAD7GS47_MYCRO|nr:hypothetical protein B0H17DRAFT_1127024 [Mycena rosella]